VREQEEEERVRVMRRRSPLHDSVRGIRARYRTHGTEPGTSSPELWPIRSRTRGEPGDPSGTTPVAAKSLRDVTEFGNAPLARRTLLPYYETIEGIEEDAVCA